MYWRKGCPVNTVDNACFLPCMSRQNYGVDYGFSGARRFTRIVVRGSLGMLRTSRQEPNPKEHPRARGLPLTVPQALRAMEIADGTRAAARRRSAGGLCF